MNNVNLDGSTYKILVTITSEKEAMILWTMLHPDKTSFVYVTPQDMEELRKSGIRFSIVEEPTSKEKDNKENKKK